MSAIERAIEVVGSQTGLAKILGVKQSHVWNWLHVHHRCPAKYIRLIGHERRGQ